MPSNSALRLTATATLTDVGVGEVAVVSVFGATPGESFAVFPPVRASPAPQCFGAVVFGVDADGHLPANRGAPVIW